MGAQILSPLYTTVQVGDFAHLYSFLVVNKSRLNLSQIKRSYKRK